MNTFSVSVVGQSHKKPLFFFSDKGTMSLSAYFVAHVLKSSGYKVFLYRTPQNIFSQTPEDIKNYCDNLTSDVFKKISNLPKREQKHIRMMGVGLGNIALFKAANALPHVTKLISLSPFLTLQTVLSYKKKKSVQDLWFDLNPINNLDQLMGKKILIYTVKNDTYIPYTEQQALIKKLSQEDIEYQLITNIKHSHSIASLIALLKTDTYLTFLEGK